MLSSAHALYYPQPTRSHMETNEDRWINIAEAAIYLGVNKDSIRNWIKKDSGIPAHKIGKQWKFKKSELDEWIKSGKSSL
jgi:excisionase family DNA binding protein